MTTAEVWERLMAETIQAHQEQADYTPGEGLAPGVGTEGDDPLGIHYADLGPLALVLNEAVDSATNRGADRDAIIEQINNVTSDEVSGHDAAAVLAGDELCPAMEILEAFSTVLSIDIEVITDAAKRGGCTNYGPISNEPPGY
jgi:hypothetical protein